MVGKHLREACSGRLGGDLADFQRHFRHQANRRHCQPPLGRRRVLQLQLTGLEQRQRVAGNAITEDGKKTIGQIGDRRRPGSPSEQSHRLTLQPEGNAFRPGRADVEAGDDHFFATSCLRNSTTLGSSMVGGKTRS